MDHQWKNKKAVIITYILAGIIVGLKTSYSIYKGTWLTVNLITNYVLYGITTTVMTIGNIYLVYKIMLEQRKLIQATNRSRNKTKATLLLCLMSFTYMLTYISPPIIFQSHSLFLALVIDTIFIPMYMYYFLLVVPFVNSVS